MTLVEVTFELQAPVTNDHLRYLAESANTYGLRRFRVSDDGRKLTFEYDASRLKETQVAHALLEARIPIARKVEA